VAIRIVPPPTNAPPDITPRDDSKGRDRVVAAIAHRSTPIRIKDVPRTLRGSAVLSNLAAARRRLRILISGGS
jgi:hypothetical protein